MVIVEKQMAQKKNHEGPLIFATQYKTTPRSGLWQTDWCEWTFINKRCLFTDKT